MKKLSILTIVVIIFLLCSCRQEELPPTFLNTPTGATTQPVTTAPSEESTAPSEESTAPTYDEAFVSPSGYDWPKDGYYVFAFQNKQPIVFETIDISTLQSGMLYIYNAAEDQCYEIGGPIFCNVYPFISSDSTYSVYTFTRTREHVYYTLESEPGKIFRTDYLLKNTELIFDCAAHDWIQPDSSINKIHFFGQDANGSMAILINNQQVLQYDIGTGTATLLMEQFYINSASYHIDFAPYKGQPLLYWSGKLNADDTPNNYLYLYFLSTGENILAPGN